MIEADLRFNPSLKPIFPQNYRADLLPEGGNVYYGVHFVFALAEIKPGDRLGVDLTFRAFPEDPCTAFQPGQKVFLKEGPLVRAEGTITRRWEHETASRTLLELQNEFAKTKPNL